MVNTVKVFLAAVLIVLMGAIQGCGSGGGGECSPACGPGQVCMGGVCVAQDAGPDEGGEDVPSDDATGEDALADDAPDGIDGTEGADTDATDDLDIVPDDIPSLPDEDGDTIADTDEGDGAVDSDGDGTPDSRDTDSDDDTIPDSVEGGDDLTGTVPVDSDRDSVPDFRDIDSDGDGILDSAEGDEDADLDGILNFRDLDSDGDFIADATEGATDSDGDGTPNFLDSDSDDDTISDLHESLQDDDDDGVLNVLDEDSDNDGVPDAEEAGDGDLSTPPLNCDDDDRENYRDTDSDNDGIPDGEELYGGCPDVCNSDSDGDGVSDLIETAYGSLPCDPADNPHTYGDFVFVVPYMESPDPTMDTLSFSTSLRQADVFFLVDTTFSMDGEIANLQASLTTTIIPQVRTTIADVWFGVGGFDDYPVNPYGYPGDRVFYLEQAMTVTTADAQSAVGRLTVHDGGDRPESPVPALWAIATGSGLSGYLAAQTSCPADSFGYPCIRTGSIPILVLITDAPFHNDAGGNDPYSGISPAPPTYATMLSVLTAGGIRVLGVNSGDSLSRTDLERLATDSGAVDRRGTALVFSIRADGVGLGDQVVNAIQALANQVPITVSTQAVDDPTDSVDATVFIDHIVPNTAGDPVIGCVGGLAAADTDSDGWDDTFTAVLPGTTVCFDIYVRMNASVPPLEVPQLFRATIDVIGDGITVLDTRVVYFLVPPVFPGQN
jgi:hypothetical protein